MMHGPIYIRFTVSAFKIFAAKTTLSNVNDHLHVFYTFLFRLGRILCKISARTAVGHLWLTQRSAQRRLYFFLWAQMTSKLHVYRERIWRFQSAQRLHKFCACVAALFLTGANYVRVKRVPWRYMTLSKFTSPWQSLCLRRSVNHLQICFFLWRKCSIFKESKMVESQCFISVYYVQEYEIRHVDRL